MKFDIWTFFFQTVNFIVLLFILKRLLYRPVRDILEKRRELVRATMEQAETTKKEALELKEAQRVELGRLEELKARMVDEMRAAVLEEKKRLIAEAEQSAAERVERAMALFEKEKSGFEAELKERGVETVRIFSGKLLGDIADRELHLGVWRRFLDGLDNFSEDVAARWDGGETVEIDLLSAYPMEAGEIDALESGMEKRLSRKVSINAAVDAALIAGVRIRSRDMVYDFSLAGQVEAFAVQLKEGI